MADLCYEATDTTPAITLDRAERLLEIRGESYPENALEFYRPLVAAVDAVLAGGQEAGLTLRVELSYLNTSTVKVLMDLLDRAEDAHQEGVPVAVEWLYDPENDRSLEMAEELREDIAVPFRLVPAGE